MQNPGDQGARTQTTRSRYTPSKPSPLKQCFTVEAEEVAYKGDDERGEVVIVESHKDVESEDVDIAVPPGDLNGERVSGISSLQIFA